MSDSVLTATQLDALRELSNISMGHAANALSRLIGETVMVSVPRVELCEFARVPEFLGGAEEARIAVFLDMQGAARGCMLLAFAEEHAEGLLTLLTGRGIGAGSLDDLAASTLMEVGNILASAFLSTLGEMLDLLLLPSVPAVAWDMAGALVGQALSRLAMDTDLALVLETEMYTRHNEAKPLCGHFLVLPSADTLKALLRVAGAAS